MAVDMVMPEFGLSRHGVDQTKNCGLEKFAVLNCLPWKKLVDSSNDEWNPDTLGGPMPTRSLFVTAARELFDDFDDSTG